jgi:hypothetical protein
MDIRSPDVCNLYWGDNAGCFQKPELQKQPETVSISFENVVSEYEISFARTRS